jgi:hypothetical protein
MSIRNGYALEGFFVIKKKKKKKKRKEEDIIKVYDMTW